VVFSNSQRCFHLPGLSLATEDLTVAATKHQPNRASLVSIRHEVCLVSSKEAPLSSQSPTHFSHQLALCSHGVSSILHHSPPSSCAPSQPPVSREILHVPPVSQTYHTMALRHSMPSRRRFGTTFKLQKKRKQRKRVSFQLLLPLLHLPLMLLLALQPLHNHVIPQIYFTH
jgi:hypothetical protein